MLQMECSSSGCARSKLISKQTLPAGARGSWRPPLCFWTSSTRLWVRFPPHRLCRMLRNWDWRALRFASRPPGIADWVCCKHFPAAGKRVEGEQTGEHTARILSSFLTEMDGLELAQGVLVMGATNRPQALDAALVRWARGRSGAALRKGAACGC